MEYLKIVDWDEWQNFRKDRGNPSWIKVHRCLTSNWKWAALDDAERGQLVSMWILAADRNGQIPNDAKVIQKLCMMSQEPNLNKFIDLGLLDGQAVTTWLPLDGHLSGKCQGESRVEKSRVEKSRGEGIVRGEGDLNNDGLNGHDLGVTPQTPTHKKSKKEKKQIDYSDIENLKLDNWQLWMDYRKEAFGKTYKTKIPAMSLARYPQEVQVWAVNNSMENEYQGLFPDKYPGARK